MENKEYIIVFSEWNSDIAPQIDKALKMKYLA